MQRNLRAEQMDTPTLPVALHNSALQGLRRINRASGIADQLTRQVLAFARGQPISLLDVASGGGDVPVAVALAARNAGVAVTLTMFDRSDVALRQAKLTADQANVPATLIRGDVVNEDLPRTADIVTCSLFLHHLQESETIAVLKRLKLATGGLLLVNDLRRCVSGLIAAHLVCRVLTRSSVVHFDGPVSAGAAWTVQELQSMAGEAGLSGANVSPVWPFRQLLRWENSVGESAD